MQRARFKAPCPLRRFLAALAHTHPVSVTTANSLVAMQHSGAATQKLDLHIWNCSV